METGSGAAGDGDWWNLTTLRSLLSLLRMISRAEADMMEDGKSERKRGMIFILRVWRLK
jgi:hypothetical protein